jgi:putative drug exporter of the RND superfamily
MERWTRLVLRHRWLVLAASLAVFVVAGWASSQLGDLLTNRFTLPGTDTQRAETILEDHFGQRTTGAFTLVVKTDGSPATLAPAVEAAARRAAAQLPTSRVVGVQRVSDHVLTAQIVSDLEPADAKTHTAAMRKAIGELDGAQTYLTGQAATEHDLDPVFAEDLKKGEGIAALIALVLLAWTFGTLAFLLPMAFAVVTIPTTLGIIYIFANLMELTTYITNLVSLIGLGIAIDYSLLMVYRFREELRAGKSTDDAIVRTVATAGRAVVFSGTAVAIGLALLLFMPLPFMRGFGVGGLVIPIVSVVAALTFLPVLLSLVGRRLDRVRLMPKRYLERRTDNERGFWARLARTIMRYPKSFAIGATALLLLMAAPVLALEVGPGSNFGLPKDLESVQGLDILTEAVGAGATAPTTITIDTGAPDGAHSSAITDAIGGLVQGLRADPEVARVDFAPLTPQFVDPTGRYAKIEVIGKEDYGLPASLDFVDRLRDQIVPAAGFPATARVYAGGGPPGGKDFLDLTYSWFPWLVLAVLVATYFLLMRAFRSVLLPLKAIVLNLLSIGAAYGLTVVVFKWGAGERLGLLSYDQVEGWIPVMVFAMLFGLSMDYEVFLVSRMREEWDNGATNEEAIVAGLVKTGRLVTSAGLIMFAAFMGFVAGSIIGLQQFGFALAAAILIDVTIVRALLVPSAMKLFGKWNWWLPEGLARVLRVPPSHLGEHRPAYRPAGR